MSVRAKEREKEVDNEETRAAHRRVEALSATYANASKSIYLYLFIAFKCFLGTELYLVPFADHPQKRINSVTGHR